MSNDNAKTPSSNSLKAEVAVTNSRKPNQSHDAAARSRSISQAVLNTLAEWHRADHTARHPEVGAAATRSPALQRDCRFYAPAMPGQAAAAFDATHVMSADQVELRQYRVKQDRNGNPLSPGANRRVTRCPLRTSDL
ncbi:hypothetical protein QP735_06530 [Curtobacterium citreum]|uniref:hypothetical protein n=1 Tax=Curtobacterium citreum TaxID=2036 RepID=UPI002550360A|nr:hypothetical protein [Curtobacterium citreum]MDK8172184.1 hypothetical protein [Curtobacterium citreum]